MNAGGQTRRQRLRRAVACVAALALPASFNAASDGDEPPKITLTAPAEGAWVGAKFTVQGLVAGAPKGAVVKLGDQTTTIGEGGAFEFAVTADREGERSLNVVFTPAAGPVLEAARIVKVDATPPLVDVVHPTADVSEYLGETAVVSGRFLDLTPLMLRVNGAEAPIDTSGRFSVLVPVPAKGETVVRIEVFDAAGNAAPAVVRRLMHWKERGPVSMSIDEVGTFWVARDGKRVPLTGDAKKDAATIVAAESSKGPLAPDDRPLLVPIRAKGSTAPFAVVRAMTALTLLPLRVSVVAPPPESTNAKLKADIVDIVGDPKDGALHVRCAGKESVFSTDDVRSLSGPKGDVAAAAVRKALWAMGTSLQFEREASTIRVRMREPVDARFLAELCERGFRGADVVLENSGSAALKAPTPATSPVAPGVPATPRAPAPDTPVVPRLIKRTPLLKRGSFSSLKPTDQQAITAALTWLAAHQSPDGTWSTNAALRWCDGKEWDVDVSAEKGRRFDVGVSGLALLALLGGGHKPSDPGPFGAALTAGLRYMTTNQDAEGGYVERATGHWPYVHAIATMAVVEAFGVTDDPVLGASAQKGLDMIALARNPHFAWRYGIKPGDNDTSMTGWMISALEMARKVNAGAVAQMRPPPLTIDEEAFDGALAWIDKMVDVATGRCGYQQRGTGPARTEELFETFPSEFSESMTAIALMIKIFCGATKLTVAGNSFDRGMGLLAALPPSIIPKARDMYYWYYGSVVMRLAGSSKKYAAMAKAWEAAVKIAVTDLQVTKGTKCETKGSWDPDDVWGPDGGRVYSTAICALMLETPIRYP